MKKEKMLPEDSANTAKAVEEPNLSLIDENFFEISNIYDSRGQSDVGRRFGYTTIQKHFTT